jgi:uncharacterized membrane protein
MMSGGMLMIELVFQLLNLVLIIAIPIVIYKVIKGHRTRRTSIEDRIYNLENKIKELENK